VSDVITIPTGYLPQTDRQPTQCNNRTGCIVYSEPVSTLRLIVLIWLSVYTRTLHCQQHYFNYLQPQVCSAPVVLRTYLLLRSTNFVY